MNRCRHDIVDNLLNALSIEPKKITSLCISGGIPVDRGKEIMSNLEKFGLVVQVDYEGEKEYKLTDRGYEWIGLYKLLRRVLPS
ncbi:MAG: hypothetical protein QXU18_10795 [Thermoplasmatales archaeon]